MKHILRHVRRGWRALVNHVVKGGLAWQEYEAATKNIPPWYTGD